MKFHEWVECVQAASEVPPVTKLVFPVGQEAQEEDPELHTRNNRDGGLRSVR
jgi:hypothetical protein